MVLNATEQSEVETRTSPHTRALPAFKVVMKVASAPTTEGSREGGYFPDGIDFSIVRPVVASVDQSLDDHAAVLELLNEDDE
jgi:hypothetical protein